MARGRSTEEVSQVQLVRPSGDIIALGTYLRARQIATQFQEKIDEAFTWAQEVLIEAKRTFESEDLVLLPKTPSAKRARKQQLRKSIDLKADDWIDEEQDVKSKGKPRATRKGAKRRSSVKDYDSKEGTVDKQSSRALRASKRENTKPNSANRNTRARKATDNEPSKRLFDDVNHDSDNEEDSKKLRLAGNPIDKTPSDNSANGNKSPFVKSPRAIPGFSSLSVKHKAEVFDSFVRQNNSTSDTPPLKNRSRTDADGQLVVPSTPNGGFASPIQSPMEVECVADTPESSEISTCKRKSSQRHSLRRSIAEKQLHRLSGKYKGAANKRSSRYRVLRQSLERTLASCEKEENRSVDEEESQLSDEDGNASSESETPAPKKPPRSKLRTKVAPKNDGSDDTPDEEQQPKRTRSKLRVLKEPPKLGAPDDEVDGSYDPKSARSADDEATPEIATQPVRSTRSKMRSNKPVVPTLPPSSSEDDDENDEVDELPVAAPASRSTRSKMRNWKNKANENMLADGISKDSPRSAVKRGKLPSSGSGSDSSTPAKRQCAEFSQDSSCFNGNESMLNASRYTPGGARIAVPVHPRSFVSSVKRLNQNPNTSMGSVVTSFINRNTPKKVTIKEKESQKRKEIEQKQRDAEERVRRKQEEMQRKADEMKKKHLDRQKQVAARREENQRLEEQSRRNQQRKALDSKALTAKMMEDKVKEERERQKQRERKAQEVEAKRKQDEEIRIQKQLEKEKQQREHEEIIQRQREQEEAERHRKLAEQRRLEEERRIDAERKHAEEKERLRREEEARIRQAAEEKRLREEREKQEKEIRLKLEREREADRERQRQEELRRLRDAELARIREQAARDKAKAEEEKRIKAAINKHNTSLQQVNSAQSSAPLTSSKTLNTTVTLDTHDESKPVQNPDSYPITPQKKIGKKKGSNNNYNIDDLNSEDSTDDEDAPRKKIPSWAQGSALKVAIVYQNYHPPDLDEVFRDCFQSLDLNIMFKQSRPRFNKRTSSACWNSPMMKPSGKPIDQSFG